MLRRHESHTCLQVAIKKDPNSQTGLIEELTEIQINETVRSYQSSLIDIPGLTLDVGLHKLVFKLEIETGVPGLPLYKTAYTYFNVTQSPLVPGFIKGSVVKVTRGWGQVIRLDVTKFSIDPDSPSSRDWNVTWWCRRVDSDPPEVYKEYYQLVSIFLHQEPSPSFLISAGAEIIPKKTTFSPKPP